MSELKYRSEQERVADPAGSPISGGDPFHPHTETERVLEAERGDGPLQQNPPTWIENRAPILPAGGLGLLRHPDGGHLVGIEQAPIPAPLSHGATVAADKSDNRRLISTEEAAARIRDDFVPAVVDPKYARHHVFLASVAGHLGADPNPPNLQQIADLLGKAEVALPNHDYPKMLYGRTLPDAEHGFESHINLRHDHVGVVVRNEEDAKKLGGGWVENPADLPKRKPEEIGRFEEAPRHVPPKTSQAPASQENNPPPD
jgi:hypothetical protein